MNRQVKVFVIVALGMMALAAGFLEHTRRNQRLGNPGVTIISAPLYDENGALAATNSIRLPDSILGSQGKPLPLTSMEQGGLPADTTFGKRYYEWPDHSPMQVTVVLMGTDRTSIHRPEYCLRGQGFAANPDEMTYIEIPVAHPFPYTLPAQVIPVTMTKTVNGTEVIQRGLYVFWFVSDRDITASHEHRMWLQSKHLLRANELQRWAYIACFSCCQPGQEMETLEWMKKAIAAGVPEIQIPPAPPAKP